MRTFPLSWVAHRQGETILSIHSIDIDPSGERFATGGQDHKVKLWSLERAFLAEEDPKGETASTLLCSLNSHTGAVHSVRFSFTGQYLASGGADGRVVVYAHYPGESVSSWNSTEKNVENWRQLRVFQHAMDVSEVAWGPESKKGILATASYDTTVNLWDVEGGKVIMTLKAHSHVVRGLVWDPLGEFLASQAEKEGIFVWDAQDGTCVAGITACLIEGPSSVEQSRLDWSPDGRAIAGAVGFSPPRFLVPLYKRGTWTREYTLVGHQGPVTVVKYNPKFFYAKKESGETNENELALCIAIGSADTTFSVWMSTQKRPIFCGKKYFASGVTDISWSKDGYTLLLCSTDGRTYGCNFDEGELGKTVTETGKEKVLYGASVEMKSSGKKLPVPESVEQLNLEKGRSAGNTDQAPKPTAMPSTSAVVNKKADDVTCGKNRTAGEGLTTDARQVPESQTMPRPTSPAKETKKRILPEAAAGPQSETGQKNFVETSTGDNQARKRIRIEKRMVAEIKDAKKGTAMDRRMDRDAGGRMTTMMTTEKTPAVDGHGAQEQAGTFPGDKKKVEIPVRKEFSVNLGTNKIGTGGVGDGVPVVFEVLNEVGRARVVCRRGAEKIWSSIVKGNVLQAAGSLNYVAVATLDRFLQVFDASGRLILSGMRLKSTVTFLKAGRGFHLLAILTDGQLLMWDVQQQSSIVSTTLETIGGVRQVSSVSISRSGKPVVFLSNRDAYVFDGDMKEWFLVADSSQPYAGHISKQTANDGELGVMQLHVAEAQGPPPVAGSRESTTSFIEKSLHASRLLNSPKEYKRWFSQYIRSLVSLAGSSEGCGNEEAKLREICMDLSGVNGRMSVDLEWACTALSTSGKQLLRSEILTEMGRNRELQRLREEVQGLLEDCDDMAE